MDKDVVIGGGADIINQYLAAGLVDELDLHVVPILLGGGERLFAGVGPNLKIEELRVVEAPGGCAPQVPRREVTESGERSGSHSVVLGTGETTGSRRRALQWPA